MTQSRGRSFQLPEGFVPRDRGTTPIGTRRSVDSPTAATDTRSATGPHGTIPLPVVRKDAPEKRVPRGQRRDFTGEPRPFLPRAFWPKALGLAVLTVFGVAFLVINDFELSAIMAMLVIGVIIGVLLLIGYLIAKANKRDDDHSNPDQGPDKVEDHRGH